MPSVAESFGIAYLEAWMCRKPVIGGRVGSTACVIADTVDGMLVDPDNPAELAGSLDSLLRDPERRGRMGDSGRRKVLASFTWDRVVDGVERVYTSARVMGRQHPRKR